MPNLPRRGGRILENGKIGVPVHSTCLEDGPYWRSPVFRTGPHTAQGSLPEPQTATGDGELRDKKLVGVGLTDPFRPERSRPTAHGIRPRRRRRARRSIPEPRRSTAGLPAALGTRGERMGRSNPPPS